MTKWVGINKSVPPPLQMRVSKLFPPPLARGGLRGWVIKNTQNHNKCRHISTLTFYHYFPLFSTTHFHHYSQNLLFFLPLFLIPYKISSIFLTTFCYLSSSFPIIFLIPPISTPTFHTNFHHFSPFSPTFLSFFFFFWSLPNHTNTLDSLYLH